MSSLVGAKGQVTIEKGIRDALGVQPGWRAVQRLEGDRVVIEFLPPKHRRSLALVPSCRAYTARPFPFLWHGVLAPGNDTSSSGIGIGSGQGLGP